jgi:hypothetical protein
MIAVCKGTGPPGSVCRKAMCQLTTTRCSQIGLRPSKIAMATLTS